MATMFEPSLSTSGIRPSNAPSMADSLPSIDFGFEDLRSRMAQFTARFDDFIEKGRKRVLEERNQFRANIAELQEDQRMKKRDIEILTLKQNQHSQTLSKETAETAEMHTAIETLTQQRDERLAHRDALKSQITEIQKAISGRREAQLKHRRYLDGQARYNEPEMEFWENTMGLRIDGLGEGDRLKFTFIHVDERDWDREALFDLDTGEREYKIKTCRPKLEEDEVEGVLERLNESRDLGAFLKEMRELFIKAMK